MNSQNRRVRSEMVRAHYRRLRFDFLEERRLLAGLQVVVFDDADGSRSREESDSVLSGKAVFVDLNLDGRLDHSEPWSVTNETGTASFSDLEPGNYIVRLVGSNANVVQTLPTQAASQGRWVDGIDKVIRVESDGALWAIRGDTLALVAPNLLSEQDSIDFGDRQLLDAVFASDVSSDSLHGFALTQSNGRGRELWRLSKEASMEAMLVPVDASQFASLSLVGDSLLARAESGTSELIQFGDEMQVEVRTLSFPDNHASELKSAGENLFVAMDASSDASRLTVYEMIGHEIQVVGRQDFSSPIQGWDVSSDGSSIAVSTADDFLVLNVREGLSIRSLSTDAIEPILFDLARNLLFTGSKSEESSLVGWDMNRWQPSLSIPIAETSVLAGGEEVALQFDSFGRFLVGTIRGKAYRQDIAEAATVHVDVSTDQEATSQIGIRLVRENTPPEFLPESLYVNEDGALALQFDRMGAQDVDGDSLVYLIRSNAMFGSLSWSEDGTGLYVPNPDSFGTESVLVQAYDGFALSPLHSIALHVLPINDIPTLIASSVDSIEENPASNAALASIRVDDPDTDSDYEYFVGDSRFKIENGALYFVGGVLSFEKEPTILLPVTAHNRSNSADSISKTLTLFVADQNDPPTYIRIPSYLTIPEMVPGVELGPIQVLDEDMEASYTFAVSDARFEVVNGVLKLRSDATLDFETDSSIALSVIATDVKNRDTIETTVTVSVADYNDPPIDLFFSCVAEVREAETGVTIGYAEVLDFDVGENYTLSINDDRFQIIQGMVSLKPGVGLTYSHPGFLDLVVTATSDRTGEQIAKSSRLRVTRDPTPHHNDDNPYDVDGDGKVTPLDPLIIINHINDHGVGPLETFGEGEGNIPDLDVDGDGAVTPIDILILINELNDITEAEAEEASSDDSAGSGTNEGDSDDSFEFEPEIIDPKNPFTHRASSVDQMFAGSMSNIESDLIMWRRLRRG